MKTTRKSLLLACAISACSAAGTAFAADPAYDQSFLADYSKLQPAPSSAGTDYSYSVPDVAARIKGVHSVMIDQPEILLSADSAYKGAKPDDLLAIANLMRDAAKSKLNAGGYAVVDAPGSGVIYVRLALTDVSLKKKKRGILSYTPAGAVMKAGMDASKDFMQKYDILEMTVQAEVLDSTGGEPLAALVAVRGGAGDERIKFEQLDATMQGFADRLRCRLDNAKAAPDKQVDCLQPATAAAPQ